MLAWVTALYAYNAQDPGDLAIMPNDRIAVLEYTNGDWWKGRNERTGQEGIFPRSYVQVVDDRSSVPPPASAPAITPNYGNMPLAVSQGPVAPATPGRIETQGKRFGKKLGDAAIFGAVGRSWSVVSNFRSFTDENHREPRLVRRLFTRSSNGLLKNGISCKRRIVFLKLEAGYS